MRAKVTFRDTTENKGTSEERLKTALSDAFGSQVRILEFRPIYGSDDEHVAVLERGDVQLKDVLSALHKDASNGFSDVQVTRPAGLVRASIGSAAFD